MSRPQTSLAINPGPDSVSVQQHRHKTHPATNLPSKTISTSNPAVAPRQEQLSSTRSGTLDSNRLRTPK
eukprot:313180-Chlamydomonas_euryale.AAC.3